MNNDKERETADFKKHNLLLVSENDTLKKENSQLKSSLLVSAEELQKLSHNIKLKELEIINIIKEKYELIEENARLKK